MDQQQIRQAGLKVTGPRRKILEILHQSERRHLTAEAVHRELLGRHEEIGLATVYRVLTQFADAGLVSRRHFAGGQSLFELSNTAHHDHLVCVRCGRVIEFCDDLIEARQEQVAATHGFRIADHALVLYGVCHGCADADADGNGAMPMR